MEATGPEPVTALLLRWRAGDQECLNRLLPQVEGELRRIAHRYMRMERQGHTLQTTALVNEAYLKLVDQAQVDWQNRAQFLGVAARLMRHILVDHARELCRGKRGGGAHVRPLDEGLVFSPQKSAALVALDDALNELAGFDPRKAQIVELRYFGGMSVEETAEALWLSEEWPVSKLTPFGTDSFAPGRVTPIPETDHRMPRRLAGGDRLSRRHRAPCGPCPRRVSSAVAAWVSPCAESLYYGHF